MNDSIRRVIFVLSIVFMCATAYLVHQYLTIGYGLHPIVGGGLIAFTLAGIVWAELHNTIQEDYYLLHVHDLEIIHVSTGDYMTPNSINVYLGTHDLEHWIGNYTYVSREAYLAQV